MNVSLLSISSCLMFFSSPHLQRSFAEKFSDDAVAGDNFSTGHEDAPPWTLFQILRWSSEGSKDFSNLTCVDSLPKLTLQVRFFKLKFGRFDYSVLPSYLAAYFRLHNRELLEHNFAVPCTATIKTLESLNPWILELSWAGRRCDVTDKLPSEWMFQSCLNVFFFKERVSQRWIFFFCYKSFSAIYCSSSEDLLRMDSVELGELFFSKGRMFFFLCSILLFMSGTAV